MIVALEHLSFPPRSVHLHLPRPSGPFFLVCLVATQWYQTKSARHTVSDAEVKKGDYRLTHTHPHGAFGKAQSVRSEIYFTWTMLSYKWYGLSELYLYFVCWWHGFSFLFLLHLLFKFQSSNKQPVKHGERRNPVLCSTVINFMHLWVLFIINVAFLYLFSWCTSYFHTKHAFLTTYETICFLKGFILFA